MSSLSYCIQIWGQAYKSNTNYINVLQNRALRIIYKINRFKNIDYIYKKLNILKFNDLKKVYMLNYMYKAFHNKLPNIVQVKYVKKYSRYNFRNYKLFHIKMSKLNTKIKWLSISGCILWNEFDLIIKNSITYSILKNSILVNIDSSNCINSFSSLLHLINRYRRQEPALTSERLILILKILFIYYAIIILFKFIIILY